MNGLRAGGGGVSSRPPDEDPEHHRPRSRVPHQSIGLVIASFAMVEGPRSGGQTAWPSPVSFVGFLARALWWSVLRRMVTRANFVEARLNGARAWRGSACRWSWRKGSVPITARCRIESQTGPRRGGHRRIRDLRSPPTHQPLRPWPRRTPPAGADAFEVPVDVRPARRRTDRGQGGSVQLLFESG
jgi:hypothetical protein